MSQSHLLEIAVFNITSALQAIEAGADRLELCENPSDGGTTPSYGTLKTVREKVSIPVFPIIRPHGGDFLYGNDEFEVMKQDIRVCKDLQFEGVVTGLLTIDGNIDTFRTQRLVELAWPMELTFHRAFDRAKNPLQALEDIISCGCNRILTSGQVPKAPDGKELIKELVEKAGERIIILPGSGIRADNIRELAKYTRAKEFHSSARKSIPSAMQFQSDSMHEQLENITVDAQEIQSMKQALISLAVS